MKKHYMKKPLSLLLSLMLAFAPVTACANVVTPEEYKSIEQASDMLEEIMRLVMEQYIGDDVTPEQLRDAALRGIAGMLDEYTEYLPPVEYQGLLNSMSTTAKLTGIRMTKLTGEDYVRVTAVFEDSPAKEAGVRVGDFIVTANGKDTKGLSTEEVKKLLATDEKDVVTMTVLRGSARHSFRITPRAVRIPNVLSLRLTDAGIEKPSKTAGYITIDSVGDKCAAEFEAAIAQLQKDGVKRLILDLRGNPGGYLEQACELCKLIVPEGPIIYTYDTENGKQPIYSGLKKTPFERIVVLVNGSTASAAEIITSALQDSGAAVIVGSRTYGKGVIQGLFTYPPTGGTFKMTTQEYFRRSGEPLNRIGVTPDVVVDYIQITEEPDKTDEARAEYDAKLAIALTQLGMANVKAFQKSVSLPQTGIVDAKTAEAVNTALGELYKTVDIALQAGYAALMK